MDRGKSTCEKRPFSGGVDEFWHDEWGGVWISAAHHTEQEAVKLAERYEGGKAHSWRRIRANLGERHGEPWLTPAKDGEHEFWEVSVD